MAEDPYERDYMSGRGATLYREKMVGRRAWDAALLSPALLTGATAATLAATGAAPVAGMVAMTAVTALPTAMLWLLFRTLRVTVTTEQVHIQFGLWGPEIPVEAIVDAQAVEYDWRRYGGFGIKYRDGTWIYNMIGDDKKAVQITWVEDGKERTTLVSSGDPATLAGAIREAMARKRREFMGPGVRVDEGAEAEHAEAEVPAHDEAAEGAR